MRRAILWLLVAVAGCKTEGMLEVRVFPPESEQAQRVDYVELFIGVPDKHYPDNVRPAVGQLAPAVWWERYPTPDFDIQPIDPDGTLYQFVPGGLTDKIGALVAVGYQVDANSGKNPVAIAVQLTSLDVPDDEVYRAKLVLGDVDPIPADPGSDRANVPGLQMWGPKADPHQCVQVNDVPVLLEKFPNAKSAMIVKSGDHDCDSYLDEGDEKECRAESFMYADPVMRDQLSCLTEDNTDKCFVGSNTCADGYKQGDCVPSNYCAPTELCKTGCTDLTCPGLPMTVPSGGVPFIFCQIPVYNNAGPRMFCSGAHAAINLKDVLPNFPLACSDTPGVKIRNFNHPFGPSFTIMPATSVNSLTFSIDDIDIASCLYTLNVQGAVQLDATDMPIQFYPMVLATTLDSPIKDRGLAVPIVVKTQDSMCSVSEGTCTYYPGNGGNRDFGLESCVGTGVNRATLVTD